MYLEAQMTSIPLHNGRVRAIKIVVTWTVYSLALVVEIVEIVIVTDVIMRIQIHKHIHSHRVFTFLDDKVVVVGEGNVIIAEQTGARFAIVADITVWMPVYIVL